jgi:MFS family permease
MTQLTTSPVMVALVQTASTLPVFLLGLPSGALADIVDRRRYFAGTQLWVSVNALVLAALSLADALTATLLLALTFVNGVGLAMRWPVFAAIVPEVVPKAQLSPAIGLNAIAMNLSRVIGPVLAGALLAAVNEAFVFALNALLAGIAFALILTWKSQPKTSALPGERFVGAMRVGLNFALQSPRLKVVLLRVFLFFMQSTALLALLPLVARNVHGGGPATFTLMFAALGAGAVFAAFRFPHWRALVTRPVRRCGNGRACRALGARRLCARVVGGAAGDGVGGHGVDLGDQLADDHRAACAARLGPRARHGDLSDGADGRRGRRLAAVGADGELGQRAGSGGGGSGAGRAVAAVAAAAQAGGQCRSRLHAGHAVEPARARGRSRGG